MSGLIMTTSDWSGVVDPSLQRLIGRVGDVQTVTLTPERRDALRRAVGDPGDRGASLADFCPDPLVLALASGLPRPALLGRLIDGGSDWEDLAEVTPGDLVAVSRIAGIEQRVTSSGRRMIRTCYETEFRDERGAVVGRARGYSLDFEGDR